MDNEKKYKKSNVVLLKYNKNKFELDENELELKKKLIKIDNKLKSIEKVITSVDKESPDLVFTTEAFQILVESIAISAAVDIITDYFDLE